MTFAGIKEPVTFDLVGDFHRDIRGAKIHLTNPSPAEYCEEMEEYMEGFATHQTGVVGDITAGLPPQDYAGYPYIEWFSDQNGRIVLELDPKQVEVIGTPLAWENEKPTSRDEQARNMGNWLTKLSEAIGAPAIAVTGSVEQPTSPQPSASHKEEQTNERSPTKAFTVAAISDVTDSFGRRGYILFGRDGEIYEGLMSPDHSLTPEKAQVLQVPIQKGQLNFAALGFELWRELDRRALRQRVPNASTATPSYSDNAHEAGERPKTSDLRPSSANEKPTPMVESEKDAPLYTIKSGRIVGDILKQDDGHGDPRYKWRINRPCTDTPGMRKLSSTFAPEDIPHAKVVLGMIKQILKEQLGQDITSEVKVASKDTVKRGRRQSL
jgi:hypothetical protein